MTRPLDRARLLQAFEALGADLAEHGRFVEIAVYGGGALMKLQALRSLDRGERDLTDARALAAHLGIGDVDALDRLYRSIYGEAAQAEARARFASVLP